MTSSRKPAFDIQVVGCKVNQAEAGIFSQQLTDQGWQKAVPGTSPDLILIHTCTVTQRADRDSRRLIQRAHADHPRARIVASGCLAEMEAESLSSMSGVEAVLPQAGRSRLAELAAQWQGKAPAVTEIREPGFFPDPRAWRQTQGRSRAWIKIQDGCAGTCTYCRVRLARGKPVSRPMDSILAEVRACLDEGYQELVLTGVNVGSWQPGLDVLLPELAALTGAFRLRLSSLEPQHLTPKLIRTWGELGPRLCPHLHLALQSADHGILRAMGRAYTGESLGRQLDALRAARPDLVLTADVITGFPGETMGAFDRTREFLRAQGFSRLHVFPFSRRPGTLAATMAGQLPSREITERARVLRALSRELSASHYMRLKGKPATLLLETEVRTGVWQGTTEAFDRGSMAVDGRSGQLVAGRVHGVDTGVLLLKKSIA